MATDVVSQALIDAAYDGRVADAAALIADGVDGVSHLVRGAHYGKHPMVSVLLAAGVDVDATRKDLFMKTALWTAAHSGHADVVATLLTANASVDKPNENGDTPLHAACQSGHVEVVAQLLAAKASVAHHSTMGRAPLHVAAGHGYTDVVTTLLAANAKVNDIGMPDGITPLYMACQEGRAAIVAQLLAANATANTATCEYRFTPLHIAVQLGNTEIASLLLSANAAVDPVSTTGATPLLLACQHGRTEIAKALLASGAAVEQTNNQGATPMTLACLNGRLAIVQLLSSYGARRTFTFAQTGARDTAENVAATGGHHDVVVWLIKSRLWSTALHHLEFLTPERALALLRAGADIHAAAEPGGPTPLSRARELEAAGGATEGTAAFLVLEAAKSWSRKTHRLFPAPARARVTDLMLIAELLSREERFAAYGPQAVVDAWMVFVVPRAVSRNRVQIVGLKGRPELNGQEGTCGELVEAKGRYPVSLEDDVRAVLIKMANLMVVGDGAAEQ